MLTPEKLLKLILLMCGIACVCGLPGMYMPRNWMAASHESLGMGRFPDPPIAEYLARLTSGLYAVYGGLVIVMAADVRRFAPLITAQAVMNFALSASALFYAWPAGIPKWWLIGDLVSVASYCAVVLFLQHKVRAAAKRPGA